MCGDDFQLHEDDQQASCFSDVQCYNSGNPVPITSSTYVIYQCVDGACEKSDIYTVECTSNAACSNGEVCDLALSTYGQCVDQQGTSYCGDNICDRDESKALCPADCGTEDTTGDIPSWAIYSFLGLAVLGLLLAVSKKKNQGGIGKL